VTSIGYWAFRDCSSLKSITVETGNTIYHSQGNCLIETASKTLILGCKNSIIPPDGSVTSIEDQAFYDCSNLTSIIIPSGVTEIGYEAFYGCSSLTSIIIPSGVMGIGGEAFYGCSSLRSVYYAGTSTEWKNISIGYDNSSLTSATVYYYSENKPTEEGNYWHYDKDGITPVVWEYKGEN
jgi:hypothetical protein